MSSLTTRIATEADIPLIQELSRKIWNRHYPPIIGQAQVDYMLDLMYSSESLKRQMMDEGAVFLLGFSGSEAVGYLSYSEKSRGNYFLHKFYIDTEKHRIGLGTQFFQTMTFGFTEPKTVSLTVNRKNIKAINFYFKTGFVIESAQDFDIGNGYKMEDFVMIKHFLGQEK